MHNIDDHSQASDTRNTIDSPRPNESAYDQCISIAGSIRVRKGDSTWRCVRAWMDNVCIGQTRIFAAGGPPEDRLCYKILARLPQPIAAPRRAVIAVTLSTEGDNVDNPVGDVTVQLVPACLDELPYGQVVPPEQAKVLHRENIYGSGPPLEKASLEVAQMVLGYLSPRSSVVDVGCGSGAFAAALMGAGHKWLGLELNNHCIALLASRGLPYRKLEGATLSFPCLDSEFDHAICIEVLEHVADLDGFLKEIARVVRDRALFSVPNMEVIPYFSSRGVVPWHLLEATHKNFFTRTSLLHLLEQQFGWVEVFSYGEHPLRAQNSIPLHLHLFAVATK